MDAPVFSGRLLRARRIARGMKPEALALAVDRSVYAVHEYERGRKQPSAAVLGRLSAALGLSIDDLFEVVSHDAA